MQKEYAVIYEHTSTGFSAYAPDVPGCAAAGDTLEEVRQLMADGLQFHFEGMLLDSLPVPPPVSHAEMVTVDVPDHAPNPDPYKVIQKQPAGVA